VVPWYIRKASLGCRKLKYDVDGSAQNIDKGDKRARLKELQTRFQAARDGNPAAYLRYNEEFHRLLVHRTGEEMVGRIAKFLG